MRNPWLAIDLSTSAADRARSLTDSWDAYLSGREPEEIRPLIAESWHRSESAGISPEHHLAPILFAAAETVDRWREHPLAPIMPALREVLASISEDARHLVVVSDASGLLLTVEGDSTARSRAEAMQLVPGALWSERGNGTNAIGTALAVDHPIQVFAAEHFSRSVHSWTCSAAPIHDPHTGDMIGVIDITADLNTVHPYSLALVSAAAQMAETLLRGHLSPKETRIWTIRHRTRPFLQVEALGCQRAAVLLDGQPLLLSRRHSEILIILALRPTGLGSDELAVALYGDFGNTVTVRAEMSRLRHVLEGCLEAHPYRLALDVQADFLTVQGLLRQGKVRHALARYRGSLLPSSDAPAIAEEREHLEVWIREAVLAAKDEGLLWTWLERPSGQDDLEVWEALLERLPARDNRRSLALAQVQELRRSYGL